MKGGRSRRDTVVFLPAILILAALILTAAAIVAARRYSEKTPSVTIPTEPFPTGVPSTEALSFPPIETIAAVPETDPPDTEGTSSLPPDSGSAETVPEPPPVVLTWKPQAVSNEYRKDETTLLFASVNQPVFEGTNEAAAARMNDALHAFCLSFVEITAEDRLLAEEAAGDDLIPFEPSERAADYTVFRRDGAVSVLFRITRSSGGPHSENELKAFVFNETTGETLGLDGYLQTEKSFAERYILSLFRQKIRQSPDVCYRDAEEILAGVISLNDYYLEKDALILFVNPGILAPAAHGMLSVAVPYQALNQ